MGDAVRTQEETDLSKFRIPLASVSSGCRKMMYRCLTNKQDCAFYAPDFLAKEQADSLYQSLWKLTPWKTNAKINRWVCLMHAPDADASVAQHSPPSVASSYQYRDAPDASIPFSEAVADIQQAVTKWYFEKTGICVEFNVCLLNFYETGQQRIGWHSDREELGRSTPIASVSLGAPRTFMLRSKTNGIHDRASVLLRSGSLVIMENSCQLDYVHSIPKEGEVEDGRINLTFRCKSETTAGEVAHEKRDNWLDRLVAENIGTIPDQVYDGNVAPCSIFGDSVLCGPSVPADVASLRFVVTTNLGAERFCAAEILETIGNESSQVIARPWGWDGCVGILIVDDAEVSSFSTKSLMELRSANHVLQFHTQFTLEMLCRDEEPTKAVPAVRLYEHVKQELVEGRVAIPALESAETFRVTCERIGGPHAFQSTEAEFEIGGAMSEYYDHCKPKLRDYDVNVLAFVIGANVVIGTQLNVMDLSKNRHFLEFRNAVTIKTNIAYIMVRCANVKEGDKIVDPFCGSGTILLEALECFNQNLRCFGMDISKKSVEGARRNAEAENCTNCEFACGDARSLRRRLEDDSVDAVVSNLPWGVMTGHRMDSNDLQTMYEVFLRTIWYTLKDKARVVMFVLRGLQMTRILRKLGGRYRIVSVHVIRTTNNLPTIVVAEKLSVDELHRSLKGQLSHLHQYVNVSPEIYTTLHTENIE